MKTKTKTKKATVKLAPSDKDWGLIQILAAKRRTTPEEIIEEAYRAGLQELARQLALDSIKEIEKALSK